ncbi:DNA alkylation repair protein [Limnohabitans sp.]|uniref:DNA alkylation repair protein n=1 Tax=Limnohabitans sp. TaxID=1907725 RepID=UPI00286F1621|nr:DNA alkylation repair protein [Limnohabitans sp.]
MSAVAMTPQQFVLAVQSALTPLVDEARAETMKAYLLNQFEFLGLPAPVRRAAVKGIGKVQWQYADDLLTAAELLWQKPEREYRYTAVDLLRQHSAQLSVNDLPALQALLLRDAWWETVDGLSAVIAEVMRAAVQQKPDSAKVMDTWLTHTSFWVRRSAMLHQLGWRLDTDTTRLFGFAQQLADEKEFFIRKAIGWALRDYARWNPQTVTGFLVQHRTRLSGLTVREAAKHMTAEVLV